MYADETLAAQFKNMNIRHYVDNMAVETIIQIGSKSSKLHKMALDIILMCRSLNIVLEVEWKSRDHPWLVHADTGSRCFDASNFGLNYESFLAVLEYFSHLELQVDTFADFWNRKCPSYFSRFKDEFASGVNFFAQTLNPSVSYYAFPPPSLIVPAIGHFHKFGAAGLLIFPVWKAAPFWLHIFPDGNHLPCWAKLFLRFLPSGFEKSEWVTSSTFANPPRFEMGVVQFDFYGVSDQQAFVPVVTPRLCLNHGCILCKK